MKKFNLISTILFCLISLSKAQAAVWETKAHWSLDYEKKYAEFVKAVPLDIFSNPKNEYGIIPTDCADAAYTLRIMFAYREGLPVNFFSSVGYLSNETKDFDAKLEGTARVRAFIDRVRLKTDSGTLMDETYPIEVSRASVRPGTMLVRSPSTNPNASETYHSGHIYIVQDVPAHGIVHLISSTVPIAVRDLMIRNGIVFAPMNKKGGFRAWKWPDSNDRPFQSEMQFDLAKWHPDSFRERQFWWDWQTEVINKLRTREVTAQEQLDLEVENFSSIITERFHLVEAGWNYYQKNYRGKGCMSEGDYEAYSTPTRDSGIQTEFGYLNIAVNNYVYDVLHKPTDDENIAKVYQSIDLQIDSAGHRMNMSELYDTFVADKRKVIMISEPEHSPDIRWGLKVISESQAVCPARVSKYLR